MKSVTPYPFNLSAGQTLSLPIEGDYFRIQSATGAIDVTVDGVGTLPDLLNGQGLKNVPFKRLTIKDKTGAANAGVILVAFDEFIDNRTYGVNDLSAGSLATLRQPLAATGFFNVTTNMAENTPEQVFSAASNINGAVLLYASISGFNQMGQATGGLIAKTTAPANTADGTLILGILQQQFTGSTSWQDRSDLQAPAFIPAGNGLWFIRSIADTAGAQRSARFRLL